MTDKEKYNQLKDFVQKQYNHYKNQVSIVCDTDDSVTIRAKDTYYGVFITYKNLLNKINDIDKE